MKYLVLLIFMYFICTPIFSIIDVDSIVKVKIIAKGRVKLYYIKFSSKELPNSLGILNVEV